MVSFGFTHFSIIVWILIKGPNGPILGQFALLLRKLRDLTHSEGAFHKRRHQSGGFAKRSLCSESDDDGEGDQKSQENDGSLIPPRNTHILFSNLSNLHLFF